MSLITDLAQHLGNHAGVAALVADRIYPVRLEDGCALPAMTYQVISGPRDFSHDGPSLSQPRAQCSCFGATYLAAHTLALQAKTALDGWIAAYGLPAFAGEPYDLPQPEPETGVYAVAVDVEIWRR